MRTNLTSHARQQCSTRGIPAEAVEVVVNGRLGDLGIDSNERDVAVFLTRTNDRGSLVGSNGDTVWAIVRGGAIATVMLRRSDQPSTKGAMRVDVVLHEQRKAVAA